MHACRRRAEYEEVDYVHKTPYDTEITHRTMAKPYQDYEDDNNEQGDEDDDIGALGSILSWDEDEDGGVGGTSNSGGESSGLPDLVSFNLKDGGLNALQQLQAAGDAPNLNLPLPTPINFAQQQITSLSNSSGRGTPQHKQGERKAGTRTQQPLAAAPPAQHSVQVTQQQLQQQLQQQHQIHQQYQIQQQQQQHKQQQASQSHTSQNAPIQPQSTAQQQAQAVQQVQAQQQAQAVQQAQAQQHAQQQQQHAQQQQHHAQQQQQHAQQQAQAVQQAQQQAAAVHAQQGAFQLFQQGAMLAQSQGSKQQPLVPTIMMQGVPQQGQDAQNQAQQFAFAADPASFLRQLQVAQLQQQFNAVQQGRSIAPQVVVPANQAPQAMQQQILYQGQAAVGPAPPPAPQAPAPKRGRGSAAKKPPPSSSAASSKAPVVSASDTDGESRIAADGAKISKKSISAIDLMLMPDDNDLDNDQSDIDMSHLTPAEKAKANRDRNREHARNTRLRKKAYLEKLKSTVDELCRERDTLVSERAGAANILVEMHNTRTEVLMSFFALRSANEKRRELWASILDESCFACVMPVTPYRSFPASEVQVSKCQRTILGIDGMMSDTASLHVLLNSLVDRSRFPNATIVFRYTLVTEEAVVAGNQMMARWVMSTLNATQCGARMEVAKQGMLCCKFNSAHKIIGLELMFDVMALMLQLKQAAGSDTFSVIPNTVQTCQRSFDKPMVMTLAEEPYTIVQVNKLWEDMTGYKAEEVVGKASCRILEGEETEAGAAEGLMNEIRFKRPASATIIRYKKNREKYRDFFLAYPLSTDSRITHYLSLSSHAGSVQSLAVSSQQSNQGVGQAQNSAVASTCSTAQLPPQVPPQAQQAYYGISNVSGSALHTQQGVLRGTQPVFHLPAVMSNPLVSTQPEAAMLTSAMGPAGVPNFHVGGLKRPLAASENDGQPAKQSKTASAGAASTGSSK